MTRIETRFDPRAVHFLGGRCAESNANCFIAGVFFQYSTPIHRLVHGHMTSNNKTVYRQMPSADNFAKTVTSNGKGFSVTRKMLATVAGNQSVLLKVA